MDLNLRDMIWPVCVLRCNEALVGLSPGEALTLAVGDPGVVHNILLLIGSQPDLHYTQVREADYWTITVHRRSRQAEGGTGPPSR
jgi:TusA-related sulfurtransferase